MKTCVLCGKPVEEAREVYVSPTCYACLPPPEPLPVCRLDKDPIPFAKAVLALEDERRAGLGRVTITMTSLDHSYLLGAVRAMAHLKCNKWNCGTVCLCDSCSARHVLPIIEKKGAP